MTTVKQLREALALLGSAHDDKPVEIWLPGSRIKLNQTAFLRDGCLMIEGNVKPGSALSAEASR